MLLTVTFFRHSSQLVLELKAQGSGAQRGLIRHDRELRSHGKGNKNHKKSLSRCFLDPCGVIGDRFSGLTPFPESTDNAGRAKHHTRPNRRNFI